VRFFDRAISQRGAMLVAAICFFFSPARHLTRFSGTELLPHRSNERARDRCDATSRAAASAPRSAPAMMMRLIAGAGSFRKTGFQFSGSWSDRTADRTATARALASSTFELGARLLDMVYPPLYAISRGLGLWWLTMPGRIREAPLPLKVRWALIAVPILMASLDVIENGCIAVMLWTWPHLSNHVVIISSLATQVKIIAGALTETLMAGLAVVWLARLFARSYM
jgi:hypothetical protein